MRERGGGLVSNRRTSNNRTHSCWSSENSTWLETAAPSLERRVGLRHLLGVEVAHPHGVAQPALLARAMPS